MHRERENETENPAFIVTRDVVRTEHTAVYPGGTATVGEVIDDMLRDAIAKGDRLGRIELLWETEEQWHRVIDATPPMPAAPKIKR